AVGLLLWQQGAASAREIAFVVTSSFVLQADLQDVGMHVRDLQRSVNDIVVLDEMDGQPLGVADRAGSIPVQLGEGASACDNVTLRYGGHATTPYAVLSVGIASGEKIGLVGHSGSGKTTFVKLIQRLHAINGGQILIDGQDIATHTQTSLRSQIATVQQ